MLYRKGLLVFTLLLLLHTTAHAEFAKKYTVGNDAVTRELTLTDGVLKTTKITRVADGLVLYFDSDEFEILPFDSEKGATIDDFKLVEVQQDKKDKLVAVYSPANAQKAPDWLPSKLTIIYSADAKLPVVRKELQLSYTKASKIDRLQVERFSAYIDAAKKKVVPASRGGRGEPVFLNNWFVGAEYPAAYSRHSNDFQLRPYAKFGNYSWIFLEGRDKEYSPREGLVSVFHFPGMTITKEKDAKTHWIEGKTSVLGIGTPGTSSEIGFLDYLATIRRPVRSFINYNNWYDMSGKSLTIENFARRIARDFTTNLKPYGVKLGAMVPDSGWQNGNQQVYGFNPKQFPNGIDSMVALQKALNEEGTELGLWLALNSYTSINFKWAKEAGLEQAVPNERFKKFKPYMCLPATNYSKAIDARIDEITKKCKVVYYKHDFNEMTCLGEGHGHLTTDRHAHEVTLNKELDLLKRELAINPEMYLNVSNWIWFSPWWLQNCNNVWMLSGDSGVYKRYPQLSYRRMAITYRDSHLFQAWGDPATRPLVPISHLMTHGIIFSDRKPTEVPTDTLEDFSDYVVMYYGRGVQLKEWYITTNMMTPERWKVLGRATRWSEENVPTLANTTLVGGDPGRGSVYGYLAFTKPSQKERQADAILTCRNPSNRAQTLKLPFDATTWYRGKKGTTYTAEVVYPYTEKLSTLFVSGKENQLTVPPYSTLVLHFHESAGVKKGMLPVSTTVTPAKIAWAGKMSDNFVVRPFELKKDKNATTPVKPTPPEQVTSDQLRFSVTLPAGKLPRCELLVTGKNSEVTLAVDGKVLTPHRRNEGNSWQMNAFDLAPFAGKKVNLQIHGAAKAMDKKDAIFPVATAPALISDITLLVDHPVKATTTKEDEKLPFPIADGYRRKTYPLGLPQGGVRISFPEAAATATAKVKLSDADLGKVKAAKLRLRIFGSNAGGVEQKKIFLNGEPVADVPTCAGDDWYSVIVTLDAAALKKIKRNNAFQLGTQGGDKYKFGNLILAVQLPDGNWVTTNQDDGVHCYDASWKFSEGTPFGKDKKSVPIELEFKK